MAARFLKLKVSAEPTATAGNRAGLEQTNADSFSGSYAVTCSEWHVSEQNSMSARDAFDPTSDDDCRYFPNSQYIDQFLAVEGEPYMKG